MQVCRLSLSRPLISVNVCVFLPAFEKDGPLTADEMEQRAIAKSKMLGNIKFIGRFYSPRSIYI